MVVPQGRETCPPNPKSLQKLSKQNSMKLVGYTFRLKNYAQIPPILSEFSELAPPLQSSVLCSRHQNQAALKRAKFTDQKQTRRLAMSGKIIWSLIYWPKKKSEDGPYNKILVSIQTGVGTPGSNMKMGMYVYVCVFLSQQNFTSDDVYYNTYRNRYNTIYLYIKPKNVRGKRSQLLWQG